MKLVKWLGLIDQETNRPIQITGLMEPKVYQTILLLILKQNK